MKKNTPKDIGNQIKELRLNKNLTQQELSESVNMCRSSLASIETGKRPASYITLAKIANALDKRIMLF